VGIVFEVPDRTAEILIRSPVFPAVHRRDSYLLLMRGNNPFVDIFIILHNTSRIAMLVSREIMLFAPLLFSAIEGK
jgi:hypothetical protein